MQAGEPAAEKALSAELGLAQAGAVWHGVPGGGGGRLSRRGLTTRH